MCGRRASLVMFVCTGVWMAGPAWAQTTAVSGRTRVSVNGGLQLGSTTFDGSTSQTVHLETAIVNSTYRSKHGPFLDGGVVVTMRNGFGVGLAGSWYSNGTDVTVNAAIPHPFVFQSPRGITGMPDGLSRDERVVHVQAVYLIRPAERLDVAVSGGPSVFRVKQTFATEVAFTEAYPYDSATFTGIATKEVAHYHAGFNLGADIGMRLAKSVGVGGVVRFSHATVTFALPNGTRSVDIDAGGLQVGAGLRLYF